MLNELNKQETIGRAFNKDLQFSRISAHRIN